MYPVLTIEGSRVRIWSAQGEPIGQPIEAADPVLFARGILGNNPNQVDSLLLFTATGPEWWNPMTGARMRTWQSVPERLRKVEGQMSGIDQVFLHLEGESGRRWLGEMTLSSGSWGNPAPNAPAYAPFSRALAEVGRDGFADFAISPAGKWLSAWSNLGEVSLWRLGEKGAELAQTFPGQRMQFIDEDRWLIVGAGFVELRGAGTSNPVWRIEADITYWTQFHAMPEPNRLLIINQRSSAYRVQVVDLYRRRVVIPELTSSLTPRLSPDGRLLLTGTEAEKTGNMAAHDLTTGQRVSETHESLERLAAVPAHARTHDGRLYAHWKQVQRPTLGFGGGSGGALDMGTRVYDSLTNRPITPTIMPGGIPQFSADGRYLRIDQRIYESATGFAVNSAASRSAPAGRSVGFPNQNTIAPETFTVSTWKWPNSPAQNRDEMVRLAQLATGRRIDDGGQIIPLSAAEVEKLATAIPRTPTAPGLLLQLVEVARGRSDWAGALALLDRLAEANPGMAARIRETRAQVIADQAKEQARLKSERTRFLIQRATGQVRQKKSLEALELYRQAFALDPSLAVGGDRYNAACCAALVGAGLQGGESLTPEERKKACAEALGWLNAEVALFKDKTPRKAMTGADFLHWQQDPDFVGVRGNAIAGLPVDEQPGWRQLWQDVAQLAWGVWKADGKELVQSSLAPETLLMISKSTWSNFDLSFEAMVVDGVGEFGAIFRATDRRNCGLIVIGGWQNTAHALASRTAAKWNAFPEQTKGSTRPGQWYSVRLEVREKECILRLDGQVVARAPTAGLRSDGIIGLRTVNTAARFRNIRVTDPSGKVLFEGLPPLP